MRKTGIIGILAVIIMASFTATGLAANELVLNGGFEDGYDNWAIQGHADEIVVTGPPEYAHSGSLYLAIGGIGLEGTGEAHAEQTFSPPVYAHTDLTLWAKGYNSPATLVVYIFYEPGVVMRHTLPIPEEWTKITVPVDKTMAVQSIRIATYDEDGTIYNEPMQVDDISMRGGFFVIPEFPYGSVVGSAAMIAALGMFYYSKERRLPL